MFEHSNGRARRLLSCPPVEWAVVGVEDDSELCRQ